MNIAKPFPNQFAWKQFRWIALNWGFPAMYFVWDKSEYWLQNNWNLVHFYAPQVHFLTVESILRTQFSALSAQTSTSNSPLSGLSNKLLISKNGWELSSDNSNPWGAHRWGNAPLGPAGALPPPHLRHWSGHISLNSEPILANKVSPETTDSGASNELSYIKMWCKLSALN